MIDKINQLILLAKKVKNKFKIKDFETHVFDDSSFSFYYEFKEFLKKYGLILDEKINVAGKNFWGYDRIFLQHNHFIGCFKHRTIDPAILYVDWATDTELPSLSECKKRAGLEPTVAHDALLDAWDVIQLIRLKQK
jgi:hypothetical protein